MIDYDLSERTFTIDGRPVTKAIAVQSLRAEGLSPDEAAFILRIHRHCAKIQYRLPPLPCDAISIREAMRLLAAVMAMEWDRQQNLRRAERWIRASLRPASRPASIYCLKHTCDHSYQRAGSACYLRSEDFAKCLRHCGLKITRDGRVYAREIRPD